MKNVSELVDHARRLDDAGRPYAVATVVKILGSTYRRPGARMIVDAGGHRGMISGGCLEPEVALKARTLIGGGAPRLLSFDMTVEDPILGFGTGCSGVVHVLVEPAGENDPVRLVRRCLETRQPGVLAQVIGGRCIGQKLLILEDGTACGNLDLALRAEASRLAREMLGGGRSASRFVAEGDRLHEILFEVVRPPLRLLAFGSGLDVEPVIRLARAMGWPAAVVGRRSAAELSEAFPEADEHVFLMHPEDVLERIDVDRRTAVVVMNHNYVRDRALTSALLMSAAFYVGVLGPRNRTERMKRELLADAGVTEDRFTRLYGPVGLDIGTETPDEIALSLVAEIQAVGHGRSGGRLRDRAGAIHDPFAAACAP